eukprot:m.53054 g.53054  ORF g.53054 m.53054 type:complete len:406 (+) comp11352_c0_seq4:95-1312(+)
MAEPVAKQAKQGQGCPVSSAGGEKIRGSKAGEISYGSYLQVDKLLSLQRLESEAQSGKPAHDEMLFIIIHQAYELWFKQILHEMGAVGTAMNKDCVSDTAMLKVHSGLHRINEILKLLVQQMTILDTMTPLDFITFRDYLNPASGFQSVQFRLFENLLGVAEKDRVKYHCARYTSALTPTEEQVVLESEQQTPLLRIVERWLERTPGLDDAEFNFWQTLQANVTKSLDERQAEANTLPDDSAKVQMLSDVERDRETFDSIFNQAKHEKLVKDGVRRLSNKATQGALLILFYRDEPRFHVPFQILSELMDIDTHVMKWRTAHVAVVQRMIGSKAGTGGSSGYWYLRSTVHDRYKVFLDLFNLSTFLVAPELLPAMPEQCVLPFYMICHTKHTCCINTHPYSNCKTH